MQRYIRELEIAAYGGSGDPLVFASDVSARSPADEQRPGSPSAQAGASRMMRSMQLVASQQESGMSSFGHEDEDDELTRSHVCRQVV